MGNDLITITIKRLDKETKVKLNNLDNVLHIQERGLDEYYEITGDREEVNHEWLEETIKDFYSAHLSVPEKIRITYLKKNS